MGWCEIVIERRDGTKTREQIGRDPLRDDVQKGQVLREIEETDERSYSSRRTVE